MKRLYLSILVSIFLTNFKVFAQYVPLNGEYVSKVYETTLAVVFEEEDAKKLKKIKDDPEELRAYKEGIEKYNSMLKIVIEREWDISKNIEFISSEKALQIKESKNPEYCILEKISVLNYRMSEFGGNGRPSIGPTSGPFSDITSVLLLTWGGKPNKGIVRSFIPSVDLPEVSFTFMVQHLENQLIDFTKNGISKTSKFKKEISNRTDHLKDRNLILYDKVVSSSLQSVIDDGSLKELYGYQYQASSDENAIDIITNHKKGFMYPIVVPTGVQHHGTILYNYYLVDSQDGRILYFTGHSAWTQNQFAESHLQMAYKGIR